MIGPCQTRHAKSVDNSRSALIEKLAYKCVKMPKISVTTPRISTEWWTITWRCSTHSLPFAPLNQTSSVRIDLSQKTQLVKRRCLDVWKIVNTWLNLSVIMLFTNGISDIPERICGDWNRSMHLVLISVLPFDKQEDQQDFSLDFAGKFYNILVGSIIQSL